MMGMVPELHRRWRREQDQAIDAQGTASSLAELFNALCGALRLAVQSAAIAAGAYLVLQQKYHQDANRWIYSDGARASTVEIAVSAWPGFMAAKASFSV